MGPRYMGSPYILMISKSNPLVTFGSDVEHDTMTIQKDSERKDTMNTTIKLRKKSLIAVIHHIVSP